MLVRKNKDTHLAGEQMVSNIINRNRANSWHLAIWENKKGTMATSLFWQKKIYHLLKILLFNEYKLTKWNKWSIYLGLKMAQYNKLY